MSAATVPSRRAVKRELRALRRRLRPLKCSLSCRLGFHAVDENQRLRDALERITQLQLFEQGNGLVVARRVARAALDGTP
jgi:hypothetical protein